MSEINRRPLIGSLTGWKDAGRDVLPSRRPLKSCLAVERFTLVAIFSYQFAIVAPKPKFVTCII